jgi:sugar diacid utilization regulator
VDFFQRAKFIAAVGANDIALLKSPGLYDRACAIFYDSEGVQLGSANIVACQRPFVPRDFEEIARMCARLTQCNSSAAARLVAQVYCDTLISDLLEERTPAEADLAALYADLEPCIFAAVVDISLYDPTLSHLAYFRDALARQLPGTRCFVYLNNVVLLLSGTTPQLCAKALAPLEDFCRAHTLYVGVSSAFQNLLELRGAYQAALDALNHGFGQPCARRVFPCGILSLERLLDLAVDVQALRPLCPAHLAALQTESPALFQTLYAYLLHAKSEACHVCLGIPKEELRTRLQTLQARLEIDWDDGNMLSSLLLFIKLLERESRN